MFGVTDDTIVVPFISHSASAPLSLRHSMSVRASPLKSPISTTLNDASGVTGVPADVTNPLAAITGPFMVHRIRAPLVERQRMSLLPSKLKSPAPATLNDGSGFTATPPEVRNELDLITVPVIVHSAVEPPV